MSLHVCASFVSDFILIVNFVQFQVILCIFVMQPEGAVVVTEDNWYAAPAEKSENKQRE